MSDDPNRTEERHIDLTVLNEEIAKGVMWLTKVLIPLAGAAVLTLVANHFQQKQLTQEVTEMKVNMSSDVKRLSQEITSINEKTLIMWAGGNWESKYSTKKDHME